MAENNAVSSTKPPARPTISLPPRGSMEALLGPGGFGASPGPLTLVSSFFSDADPASECRSFSQLLAGAMASPAAVETQRASATSAGGSASANANASAGLRFKENRPPGLVVTQPHLFIIPPGVSPANLLESPGLFPPGQGPFGMSHQQALAHVTSQAQSGMYMQGGLPSSSIVTPPASLAPFSCAEQESLIRAPDSRVKAKEESHFSNSDETPQSSSIAVDKPADDGYNWRKYGQKQVKGCEFPRSYYKCTHPNCPVKKKVERSLDGQITEIIYKGQHNHPPPQSNKRGKDTGNPNVNLSLQSQIENGSRSGDGLAFSLGRRETTQATGECLAISEEAGDEGVTAHEGDEDEPEAKRRDLEVGVPEQAASHRTVTEPRIIVQTTSEVDLLDDGYRWRKYGQKVVKGNPYPRSYYKCTYQGCNVRKHIERASTNWKAVITTYEGKHNHDVPAPRTSSHNTANNIPQPPRRPQSMINQSVIQKPDFPNNNHQPVAYLQLKEERIS